MFDYSVVEGEWSSEDIFPKFKLELWTKATADYYFCNGSSEEKIGSAIDVASFIYCENDKAAFISSYDKNGCLYIYSDGKSAEIAQNVSEILLFE